MSRPSRRVVVSGIAASGLATAMPARPSADDASPFDAGTVERQARALARLPFEGAVPPLPPALANLDYDGWRDIRFRPDQAFLGEAGGPFRLQLFHRGFLYPRPVAVSLVRDGLARPIRYDPRLFDFGRTRLDETLPPDFGFAGIRIHCPLNRPDRLDELIVFVGASYFRFLGRDQAYGLSARALANGTDGEAEEFPFFRAFFIETPGHDADALTIHALLDGPSQTGAYRFMVHPADETVVSVEATLYPRRALAQIGIAPLTSMFFIGEARGAYRDDYRPELHDSDGLQIAAGSGEWLWRPLENPPARRVSSFDDRDPKGFGLFQRDRAFENYQDLEAAYERRPSYFVEPVGAWGEGRVMLVELPTDNETADNVVAFWRPSTPFPAGDEVQIAYRIRATRDGALHPNAHVLNSYVVDPVASGAAHKASAEAADRLRRRFLVDFTGGELAHFLPDPRRVEVVASATHGTVRATSVTANPHIDGVRAAIDVVLSAPGTTELRAFLRTGGRTLSETWSTSWTAA